MKYFNCKNLFFGSLFLLPLIFNPFTGNVEGVKFILFGLTSLILFFCNNKRFSDLKSPIIWALIAIVIAGGFATIFSIDVYTAFFGSTDRRLGFASYSFFILLILNLPKIKISDLKKHLIISGSLTSIAAIVLGFIFNTGLFENRIGGTLGNPNFLGQFLAITIFLNAYELINNKKKSLYLYGGFFVQIFALLMTGNRASILALVIGLIMYLFFNRKRVVYLISTFVFSSAFVVLSWGRFVSSQSIITRLELYSSAFRAIWHRPFFGIGFEQIQYALDVQNKYSLVADRVHQLYLDAMLSAGIFFGLAFLIISFFVLKKLYSKKDFFYAFLIMLLSLQFGFMGVFGLFLFAVFVGVAMKEKS